MSNKLIKIGLILGALALVMLALTMLSPVDGKVVAADPTATPTAVPPTPTPVPFTGTAKVVAMYPGMGTVNPDTARPAGIQTARGDDKTKTYAVFGPGMSNVPVGVPVYVQAGAFGFVKNATAKSYAWTVKGPSGSTAKIDAVTKAVPGLTLDMATFTPDKKAIMSSAWSSPTARAPRACPAI